MEEKVPKPPLKFLHGAELLRLVKLEKFRSLATRVLLESLHPGLPGSLKTRPDGTILDGHHRIAVLRERGVEVDALPRDVLEKRPLDEIDNL